MTVAAASATLLITCRPNEIQRPGATAEPRSPVMIQRTEYGIPNSFGESLVCSPSQVVVTDPRFAHSNPAARGAIFTYRLISSSPTRLTPMERFLPKSGRIQYGVGVDNKTVAFAVRPNHGAVEVLVHSDRGTGRLRRSREAKDSAMFGADVIVTQDFLIVSDMWAAVGAAAKAGISYVYRRSVSGEAVFEQALVSPSSHADGQFRIESGNANLLGAMDRYGAYLFERTSDRWAISTTLSPLPAGHIDGIYIHGTDFAAVRIALPPNLEDVGGLVAIFERRGLAWSLVNTLRSPWSKRSDRFGAAVARQGSWLVVTDPSVEGTWSNTGAAFVYRRSAAGWGFAYAIESEKQGISLGTAAAFCGEDLLFLGAPGLPSLEYTGAVLAVNLRDAWGVDKPKAWQILPIP
jgi:hypothetical protein